jgi:phage I-like protein
VAEFDTAEREKLASSGAAMPGGEFPIRNVSDLKNAIRAVGRAKDPSAAKAHIKKRAAALGQTDLIPENWKLPPDGHVVAFAVDGSNEAGVSKPFEILRADDFKRGAREVQVTEADLDQAVANFNRWKAMGQEIPVDYDHAFNEGREAPAAGWYDSLIKKGQSLWATIRWTSKARDEIASEQYRFFSPEFVKQFHSETGEEEGFTILAGALTNRPFLRGMTPVALNQEVEREIIVYAAQALEAFDTAPVTDTSPEVSKELNKDAKVETFKVEIDGEAKELNAEEIIALHAKASKVDEAEKAAKEKAAEAAASKGQVETLSTRVETLEQDAKDRDFKELFNQMKSQGRLDAKSETEETWKETFATLGVEKTRKLMEQIPAETIPLSAQGRSGSGDQSAAPVGFHAENFAINQKVEAYLAEHPDTDFSKALDIVSAQAEKATG